MWAMLAGMFASLRIENQLSQFSYLLNLDENNEKYEPVHNFCLIQLFVKDKETTPLFPPFWPHYDPIMTPLT
jgi:hypothetical protein